MHIIMTIKSFISNNTQVLADDVSVNKTDTPPTIQIAEVMKDAEQYWRLCNICVKNAWDMHA